MGRALTALGLALATMIFLYSPPIAAEQPERDQAKTEEAFPVPAGLELGARLGGGASARTGFALVGLDLGYRVMPELVLGGYGQTTLSTMAMSTDDCGNDCTPRFVRLGARGELHLLPDFFIDPWAGLGAGALMVGDDARAELLVEGGVDARPTPHVAVGAFVSLAPTPGNGGAFDGITAVGLRFSASFGRSETGRAAQRRVTTGARL